MLIANVCCAAVAATHRFIARVRSQLHSGHPLTDVRVGPVIAFRAAADAGCQGTPNDFKMPNLPFIYVLISDFSKLTLMALRNLVTHWVEYRKYGIPLFYGTPYLALLRSP